MTTPQRPEQIGICSWSTHAKGPAELIERLDQIGLKKVQLALGPLRDRQGPWKDVASQLSSGGYQVVSGMFGTVGEDYSTLESIRRTGGLVPDEHWEENLAIATDVASIAAGMAIPQVSSHAGFLPPDVNSAQFRTLVERVGRVSDVFAKHDIELLFETGQESADTLSEFLDALEAAGHRNCRVNFDPANMILYNMGEPVAALRKLLPRVVQVHIKDARYTSTPGTWGKEVPIGDGEVDWKAFMNVLAEGDYQGSLIIEREAGADRVGDIRKAIAFLGEQMKG